jgi:hypothetical protein
MITFEQFCEAVQEAETVERMAKATVQKLARMCRGRLRMSDVDTYTLSELKRELRDWDMTRSMWRIR